MIVDYNFLSNWCVLVATLLVTYIYHMRFCAILRFLHFVESDMWLQKNNNNNRKNTHTE